MTTPFSRVAIVSTALVFFTLPHVLEDFALGEPQSRGVPALVIATVVSLLFAAQAAALYALGNEQTRGLWAHAILGALWPLAAGFAQLPEILFQDAPYRSGAISIVYVFGIILGGITLCVTSLLGLRQTRVTSKVEPTRG
jgi:hypothetical protein